MKIGTYQALSTRRAQLPSLLPVRGHQAACVTDARRNNPAVVAFDFWRAFFAPQPVRADLPRGSSNPAGLFFVGSWSLTGGHLEACRWRLSGGLALPASEVCTPTVVCLFPMTHPAS